MIYSNGPKPIRYHKESNLLVSYPLSGTPAFALSSPFLVRFITDSRPLLHSPLKAPNLSVLFLTLSLPLFLLMIHASRICNFRAMRLSLVPLPFAHCQAYSIFFVIQRKAQISKNRKDDPGHSVCARLLYQTVHLDVKFFLEKCSYCKYHFPSTKYCISR